MDSSSTSVSIGKFPFDYTEDQVLDIARSVGPVLDLKLLFDELTGKSKGYAIISYGDNETAASAVRNLNYMTLPNGRFLKCAFINDYDSSSKERLPPLPLGVQIHPNQNVQQVISNILSNIDSTTALEILKEAKTMSLDNPKLTKLLLDRFPQLAHALVELSLISNTTNADLIEITLNKKQPVLNELSYDHVTLLKSIHSMPELELQTLDESKRAIVTQIKTEIDKGSYGQIL